MAEPGSAGGSETDDTIVIRRLLPGDQAGWQPLWDGYNAFYGRCGPTALAAEITAATWQRLLADEEPVHALVAVRATRLIGLAHYVYHRSTTRLHDVCYLQDLYTAADQRGGGVGRRLIEGVIDAARAQGCSRLYWQTQASNQAGRALYDRLAHHAGFIVYGREL